MKENLKFNMAYLAKVWNNFDDKTIIDIQLLDNNIMMIYFNKYTIELVDITNVNYRYYVFIDKKMKDIVSKTGVKYFINYQIMLLNGKPTYNYLYPDGILK